MKKDANFKVFLVALCLLFGLSAVHAQSGNEDLIQAKLEHQISQQDAPSMGSSGLTVPDSNQLVRTSTEDGVTTYVVLINRKLADAQLAADYENKLLKSGVVMSAAVDANSNTATVTIKGDDEEGYYLNALFDIQK